MAALALEDTIRLAQLLVEEEMMEYSTEYNEGNAAQTT